MFAITHEIIQTTFDTLFLLLPLIDDEVISSVNADIVDVGLTENSDISIGKAL